MIIGEEVGQYILQVIYTQFEKILRIQGGGG